MSLEQCPGSSLACPRFRDTSDGTSAVLMERSFLWRARESPVTLGWLPPQPPSCGPAIILLTPILSIVLPLSQFSQKL